MPDRGARVMLGGRAPSLDLPLLLDALAEAACPDAAAPRARRLLSAKDGCVTVNLASAIRRLCLTSAMKGLAQSADGVQAVLPPDLQVHPSLGRGRGNEGARGCHHQLVELLALGKRRVQVTKAGVLTHPTYGSAIGCGPSVSPVPR